MNIKTTLLAGAITFASIATFFSIQHRPKRVKCDASKISEAMSAMSLDKRIVQAVSAFPIPQMSGEVEVAGGLRYYRGYLAVRGQSPLARESNDRVFDWLHGANLHDVGIQEEPDGIRSIGTHVPWRVNMTLDAKRGTITVLYGEGDVSDLQRVH